MDPIAQRLASMSWTYGDGDTAALALIKEKIARTGRKADLLTYGQLLRGITFRLSNVAGGTPFDIDLAEGRELDRAILGSFLGRACADSYVEAGFMASALVVTESERKPGAGFAKLMHEIGAIPNIRRTTVEDYWLEQVTKAHEWFHSH